MDYSPKLQEFFETFPIFFFFFLAVMFVVFSCNYFLWREIESQVEISEAEERNLWTGKNEVKQEAWAPAPAQAPAQAPPAQDKESSKPQSTSEEKGRAQAPKAAPQASKEEQAKANKKKKGAQKGQQEPVNVKEGKVVSEIKKETQVVHKEKEQAEEKDDWTVVDTRRKK